jgi:hypothetical protein
MMRALFHQALGISVLGMTCLWATLRVALQATQILATANLLSHISSKKAIARAHNSKHTLAHLV